MAIPIKCNELALRLPYIKEPLKFQRFRQLPIVHAQPQRRILRCDQSPASFSLSSIPALSAWMIISICSIIWLIAVENDENVYHEEVHLRFFSEPLLHPENGFFQFESYCSCHPPAYAGFMQIIGELFGQHIDIRCRQTNILYMCRFIGNFPQIYDHA